MDYHVGTMSHTTMYVSDHYVNRVDTFAYQWLETELRQAVCTRLADKEHRRIHAALWACAGAAPQSALMQTWPCLQSAADARDLHRRRCCGRTPTSAGAAAPAGPGYVRHKASSPHTRPEQRSTEVASRVRLCPWQPARQLSHVWALASRDKNTSCGIQITQAQQTQTGMLLGVAHCVCAQSLLQRCSSFIEEFERILGRQ